MKKALKRLNGKTIRSVTEKKAAIEDDGEIDSQRVSLRNKGDTGNSRVGRVENTRKCSVRLHRSRMRQEVRSNSSVSSRQEADIQTNENPSTDEQNIKTSVIARKNKRKGTQLVSRNDPYNVGRRINKSKVLLKRVETSMNSNVNKQNVPSILAPFLKSPEGSGTTSKKDQIVEHRHRLSLSRKKLENRDNTLRSGSSLEQSSTDDNEDSKHKEASSKALSELHNEETSAYSNINDKDIVEENNQHPIAVPKTPKCAIRLRRILLPKASESKEKTARGRRGRKKLDSSSPKPPAKPEANRRITEQLPVPREACKSPDIFSDSDAGRASDIYAFHTQSSQSEHEDIAADIIEKMKKEGKIKLVKPKHQHDRKNNTMRPANWLNVRKNLTVSETTVKQKVGRPPKKVGVKKQNKTTSAVDGTTKRRVLRSKKKVELQEKNPTVSVIEVDDHDHDDHFDVALNHTEGREPEPRLEVIKTINRKADGFSPLAQKVLQKQTAIMTPGKPPVSAQNKDFDKIKLLQIAKTFVRNSNVSHSTPNKPSGGSIPTGIRPMPASPSNGAPSSGGASPWRVDSENIPRLFYFSRTSDNLPSYSSDVIPSSQPTNDTAKRKDASKNSTAVSPSRILSDSLNISAIQDISPIKSHNNSSLNISNIENISPVKPLGEKGKENSILNPNPRRGLADRSPLKPINILNVVKLPNRINTNQVTESINPPRGDKENVTVKPNRIHNLNKTTNATLNNNTLNDASIASDFFGFDDEENIEEEEELQSVPKSKLPSKKRLHHKLIKLKRLLPPKPTRVSYGTIRSIFNSPKKQKDIREMLSSTRAKAGTDANVTETSVILDDDSSNDEMSSIAQNEENSTIVDEDLHLFDDPAEPQSSFNASMKIRTYERPKRKAKRIRSFILFHTDSENEDESSPNKPKRTKPDKNKKELTKFVSEFNSMCEEVDQYELVVEKDKSG